MDMRRGKVADSWIARRFRVFICGPVAVLKVTASVQRTPVVIHMLPKRVASTSPVDLNRDAKRLCLEVAPDLWSNEEHQQQDEVIKRRLVGRDGKPREY